MKTNKNTLAQIRKELNTLKTENEQMLSKAKILREEIEALRLKREKAA